MAKLSSDVSAFSTSTIGSYGNSGIHYKEFLRKYKVDWGSDFEQTAFEAGFSSGLEALRSTGNLIINGSHLRLAVTSENKHILSYINNKQAEPQVGKPKFCGRSMFTEEEHKRYHQEQSFDLNPSLRASKPSYSQSPIKPHSMVQSRANNQFSQSRSFNQPFNNKRLVQPRDQPSVSTSRYGQPPPRYLQPYKLAPENGMKTIPQPTKGPRLISQNECRPKPVELQRVNGNNDDYQQELADFDRDTRDFFKQSNREQNSGVRVDYSLKPPGLELPFSYQNNNSSNKEQDESQRSKPPAMLKESDEAEKNVEEPIERSLEEVPERSNEKIVYVNRSSLEVARNADDIVHKLIFELYQKAHNCALKSELVQKIVTECGLDSVFTPLHHLKHFMITYYGDYFAFAKDKEFVCIAKGRSEIPRSNLLSQLWSESKHFMARDKLNANHEYLCHVQHCYTRPETPNRIFYTLRLVDDEQLYSKMVQHLNMYYRVVNKEDTRFIFKGDALLHLKPQTKLFTRCVSISDKHKNQVEVRFIDKNCCAWVDVDELYPMPNRFYTYPPFAITLMNKQTCDVAEKLSEAVNKKVTPLSNFTRMKILPPTESDLKDLNTQNLDSQIPIYFGQLGQLNTS
ncbi:hypothetical protein M3Y94_00145300 [Aphelenchoides besseyi]|nr:hypothetical protein M3Y94_00145300 [Aphelenchoides besseyi]KAI6237205.1 hypothetical protein M3Y95_00240700 [Aphelenchoides besseyi]